MKFIVSATTTWNPKELTESYPAIYDYDHEVEKHSSAETPYWIKTYIRLDTLAELIEFINKIDEPIIINNRGDDEYEIEIYDNYRE